MNRQPSIVLETLKERIKTFGYLHYILRKNSKETKNSNIELQFNLNSNAEEKLRILQRNKYNKKAIKFLTSKEEI